MTERIFVIEPLIDSNEDSNNLIYEIKSLIETAGGEYVGIELCKIREITPATFIGKGKLLEIASKVSLNEIDTVVFDGQLSPSQTLNMAEVLGVKVIDRTTLILDIFAKNALSYEGKLQVELAQLNYIYPRLKGKGEGLSRLGGGIGSRGPGESKLETDRRYIRGRINKLKEELEVLKNRRDLQKERRNKNSELVVALVGYTNAGKSTLLNLLTDANVLAENKLFATLDSTYRKCTINEFEVLLVDTVGFIKNIPTTLIEAFKSTLDIAVNSDLNLIVCDGSINYQDQLKTTQKILDELNSKVPSIIVINKCDKLENLEELPKNAICISAKNNENIDKLKEQISKILKERFITLNLKVGYDKFGKLTKLLEFIDSYNYEYLDTFVQVKLTIKKVFLDKFKDFMWKYKKY